MKAECCVTPGGVSCHNDTLLRHRQENVETPPSAFGKSEGRKYTWGRPHSTTGSNLEAGSSQNDRLNIRHGPPFTIRVTGSIRYPPALARDTHWFGRHGRARRPNVTHQIPAVLDCSRVPRGLSSVTFPRLDTLLRVWSWGSMKHTGGSCWASDS